MDLFSDSSLTIDLRDEMDALLFGNAGVTPQGRPVALRRITDVRCACWDGVSGGPNKDCSYCGGEGYLWTESQETMIIFRGVAPIYKPGFLASSQYPMGDLGYTDPNRGTAYCRWDVFPDYERYTIPTHKSYDKMYELKVGPEGGLSFPVVRTTKWKLLNVVPLFGDFGRVEFFELTCDKETV